MRRLRLPHRAAYAIFFAACGTNVECHAGRTDGGITDRYCYVSGARAVYTQMEACTSVGRSVVTVTKPDGSPCFTYEISDVFPGSACENGNEVWRNAAGETVATGTFSYGIGPHVSIVCTVSGETMSCDPNTCPSPSGGIQTIGNTDCTPGDCP
jgi:hypothetical protein